LPGVDPAEAAAFLAETADMDRAVKGAIALATETMRRIESLHDAFVRSEVGDAAIAADIDALRKRLAGYQQDLSGNAQRRSYGDDGPISINARLRVAQRGTQSSTYGPTPTHIESMRIARSRYEVVRAGLDRLIGTDLPAIEARLEAAGAPWSPGRSAPEPR
jgi:hypothetical protein